MISINNLSNNRYNPNFGNNKVNNDSIVQTLRRFENQIIAREQLNGTPYDKEVINSIENKFGTFLPKIANLTPKQIAVLKRPLDSILKQNPDITSLYIALGDFEKNLPQI